MENIKNTKKKKAGRTTIADWVGEGEKKEYKTEVSIMEELKPFTPTSVIRLPKRRK